MSTSEMYNNNNILLCLRHTYLPPETVEIVTPLARDGSRIDGYVSTIAFQAQAALIAAGTPPPEKAIPSDMMSVMRIFM